MDTTNDFCHCSHAQTQQSVERRMMIESLYLEKHSNDSQAFLHKVLRWRGTTHSREDKSDKTKERVSNYMFHFGSFLVKAVYVISYPLVAMVTDENVISAAS